MFIWIKRAAISGDSLATFSLPTTITNALCVTNISINTAKTDKVRSNCMLASITTTQVTLLQDTYSDSGGYIWICAV